MKNKNDIKTKVENMVSEWSTVRTMYEAMDAYDRNAWKLPPEMEMNQWAYKGVDTSPGNALRTATKVLSAEKPKITYHPLGNLPEDQDLANRIEWALLWNLYNADKRARTRIVPDMNLSSLKYARICVQVVHLPSHYRGLGAKLEQDLEMLDDEFAKEEAKNEFEAKRNKALRMGDFAFIVRNPQNVFSRHDEMGLESVAMVQRMTGKAIHNIWGARADFLVDPENIGWEEDEYDLYDYYDVKERMVFVITKGKSFVSGKTILHENHGLPFIPWVDRMHGSGLDSDLEYQVKPFLESVYRSKSWESLNVLKTLGLSEALKYAGSPRSKSMTSDGKGIGVTYGGTQGEIRLKPGQDWDSVQPPIIDRQLMEWYDRLKNELNAQTAVQVLADLNFPAGTAYATVNAVLQTAIASLQPYKLLTESALADMFEIVLLYVAHTHDPLRTYGYEKKGEPSSYVISYDRFSEPIEDDDGTITETMIRDFDPRNIYIEVELNASAPTDRTERLNAGVMAYKNLPISANSVLTEIGYTDPLKEMRDRTQEDFTANEGAMAMQQRQAETQAQIQMLMFQVQMQQQQMMMQMQAMQQAQQQQQQQQQQQAQGAGMPGNGRPQGRPPNPGQTGEEGAIPAYENTQGMEGMNPNQPGGVSPQTAAPGMTRETITGQTQGGEPIA